MRAPAHRAPRARTARAARSTRLHAAGLTVALLVLVTGTALAVWIAWGGGQGEATTGTTDPVAFSPGVPSAQLYPGGTAEVALTMTNPNTAAVLVRTLVLDTSQGTDGFGADAGCTSPQLSYTTQDNAGAGWTVPGRVGATPGSLDVTLPAALAMGTGASDECQGTTFAVFLRATS